MPYIIHIVLILIVIGVLLWLFNNYVDMIDVRFKKLINAVVIVCTVLWLLGLLLGYPIIPLHGGV